MSVSVIIPCAGKSVRFGELKQFKILNDEPLVLKSIKIFAKIKKINEIIIPVPKSKIDFLSRYIEDKSFKKNIKVIKGGSTRQESVEKGMEQVNINSNLVCIHDAARPFVKEALIENCIKECDYYDGSIVAIKSTDTIKFAKTNTIEKTIDRNNIWLAQTPQVFDKIKLKRAISYSKVDNLKATDESYLMERMGFKINIIEGSMTNFKITFKSDWPLAEHIEKSFNEYRI